MRWFNSLFAIAGIVAASISQCNAAGAKPKHLIEFGWDEPDTTFLRGHIQELQQSPFDGCVFHADYNTPGTNKGSFAWQAWGTQTFTEADLKAAFADLRATHFG